MRRHTFILLGAILLCSTSAARLNASTNEILAFANLLYAQKDYYRAITEYKRFVFLNPTDPMVTTAEYQIALSYRDGGKFETAAQVFLELADRHIHDAIGPTSLLMAADAYAQMENFREARDRLELFLSRYPDNHAVKDVQRRIAWYWLCLGEADLAAEQLQSVAQDGVLDPQTEQLIEAASRFDHIPKKSPYLAGCLSAALPGAGQLYTGRRRDALVAFMINGGLIWAAVEAYDEDQTFAGAMFALLDVSWYAGNIYNAVNNAHKVNRKREQDFLNDVEVRCGLGFAVTGDGPAPALALTFDF